MKANERNKLDPSSSLGAPNVTSASQEAASNFYPEDISAASRRQAFIYGSSFLTNSASASVTGSRSLRPRSHDLYDYGGPTSYDTGSSRYLDVPSSNNYHTQPHSSNRYSFDASAVSRINDGLSATLPTSSHQSATFTRQHSWESPVRYRRMQYGYACMAISHDTT